MTDGMFQTGQDIHTGNTVICVVSEIVSGVDPRVIITLPLAIVPLLGLVGEEKSERESREGRLAKLGSNHSC